MTTPVWIGLGSNLGDRRAILDAAVQALVQTDGVTVTQVSTYRETLPVGGPPGQGPFLNAAARLDTTLSPRALVAETQRIEADLGRVRVVRWGERTLDIDLLIFGCKTVAEPDLKIPHPRLAVRRFVLEPLAEIAPQIVDMISMRRVDELLANLDRSPKLMMIHESIQEVMRTHRDRLTADLNGAWIRAAVRALPFLAKRSEVEGHIRELLQAVDAIMAARDRDDRAPSGWLIVDDVFNMGEVAAHFAPRIRSATRYPHDVWLAMLRDWQRRSGVLAWQIPVPTLIVAAAGTSPHDGSGGITPIYRPEASEPDAIIAEVVAVCRGIAGE